MSKFDKLYKIIMEEVSCRPTTNKPLSNELCNLDHLFKWIKGRLNEKLEEFGKRN